MNNFLKSWNKKYNVIVVFPGVFDPVHRGHISAAKAALSEGRKVLLIPERVPQHKHGATDYKQRLEMLRMAVADQKNIEAVDYSEEQFFVVPFFTWLKELYPDYTFKWLVGSDVVEHMHSWKDIDQLSKLDVTTIHYMNRNGSERGGQSVEVSKDVGAYMLQRRRWRRTRDTHMNMSSSKIRENLGSLASQLPDGVYEYIKTNDLY